MDSVAAVMDLVRRRYPGTKAQSFFLVWFNPEMIDRSCERSSRKPEYLRAGPDLTHLDGAAVQLQYSPRDISYSR
jgi:hypothetical protein